LFWNKRIAPVAARIMTWEVTTAFDGVLTETELRKRFDEELGVYEERVCFWPLVSFNASDGRRHRYLVALADEPLLCYRKKFDRCLPKQVLLYALADKIMRGSVDDMNFAESEVNGNLLLVALWEKCLYIFVFVEGRLCHWSEEHGYGENFDELCERRILRFREFLKADELLAGAGCFHEVRVNGDGWNANELFHAGACDPFWRQLDLDACTSMKSCGKSRWTLFVMMALCLCVLLMVVCENPLLWKAFGIAQMPVDAAVVELDLPSDDALERLAWAKGHNQMRFVNREHLRLDSGGEVCELPSFKLLGIVGDRAALVKLSSGESKTILVGDSLNRYRVKSIGKNDAVLRCGAKEMRYEVGAR